MSQKDEASKNAWNGLGKKQEKEINQLAGDYVDFLNQVKTERDAIQYIEKKALANGFVSIKEVKKLQPGQKIFIKQKNKTIAMAVIGTEPLEAGFNIVASHIDAPRIDLKARPLYEADGLALFKTHYYGGIKKYQWVSIPLSLHGIVIKKDGSSININIGNQPGDPVFTITDLLPHLAKDQMEMKMAEAIKGENLNILIGSQPENVEKDPIKEKIINILSKQYNIEADDFCSAELELVPAFLAAEIGFDRSLIGGYGQDDRSCAYASLNAILQIENPKRTALCLFVDKEEIGSTGNTGLNSLLMENIFMEILNLHGQSDYYNLRQAMINSYALSADVNAAVDPNYPEVFEKMNCSFVSQGVVLTKFTGSRGKSDANDANPEFIGRLRGLLDKENIVWQVGELGKVDIGGGGTVAKYMAYFGMEVLDCGVAVLGMHSPFEVVSKADVYMTSRAYQAFMQKFSWS